MILSMTQMKKIGIKAQIQSNYLLDIGFTKEEEEKFYDDLLEDIILNPRWYLNNFTKLKEVRVSWANYRSKSPVLPKKYSKMYEKTKPL